MREIKVADLPIRSNSQVIRGFIGNRAKVLDSGISRFDFGEGITQSVAAFRLRIAPHEAASIGINKFIDIDVLRAGLSDPHKSKIIDKIGFRADDTTNDDKLCAIAFRLAQKEDVLYPFNLSRVLKGYSTDPEAFGKIIKMYADNIEELPIENAILQSRNAGIQKFVNAVGPSQLGRKTASEIRNYFLADCVKRVHDESAAIQGLFMAQVLEHTEFKIPYEVERLATYDDPRSFFIAEAAQFLYPGDKDGEHRALFIDRAQNRIAADLRRKTRSVILSDSKGVCTGYLDNIYGRISRT